MQGALAQVWRCRQLLQTFPAIEASWTSLSSLSGSSSGSSSFAGAGTPCSEAHTTSSSSSRRLLVPQQKQQLLGGSRASHLRAADARLTRPGWLISCRAVSSSSNSSSSNSSSGSDAGSSSSGDSATASSSSSSPSTLQASMDKLVDAAVGLVEQGKLQQAVEVLQQGITLLEQTFPGSLELSELHNQAALLLLFSSQPEPAAKHAVAALELTQKHLGPQHPLTGHRLLRLASIKVAAGQLQEAQPLLAAAADMLGAQPEDPTLSEALFYLHLLALAAADSPGAVAAATPGLQEALRQLTATLGPESMIVRLALSAHSRLVGAALDGGLAHGEAAFKQHISLQEIQDPHSAELGLTLYQLATTYYSHDLLTEAGPALQRATALMRAHYPPDHDLVTLCKHRLGMICAAGRDGRSATALLGETGQHYSALQPDHPLAAEAQLGLAMAELKALDPRLSGTDKAAAVSRGLTAMRAAISTMAAGLGPDHLLVAAASRYLAQLSVMLGVAVVPDAPV